MRPWTQHNTTQQSVSLHYILTFITTSSLSLVTITYKMAVFNASLLGFTVSSRASSLHVPYHPHQVTSSARARRLYTHMARVVVAPVIHVSTERRFLLARAGQEKKTRLKILPQSLHWERREREEKKKKTPDPSCHTITRPQRVFKRIKTRRTL